jgi:16S rRNA (adenine1518-N6/adenine1519-N6)-dimethyltransferase
LSFNFQEALQGEDYRVVANIPYYITGKIVQLFLRAQHKPKSITLLVQKEVAHNIAAKAGRLNLLAISVQLYGTPEVVRTVPAKSFFPAPKVDSAVVHIELHDTRRYEVGDEKKLFRILRACFAGKRKQIHNTLVNNLKLEKEAVGKVLEKLKIDPAARPQQLTIQQWLSLSAELQI